MASFVCTFRSLSVECAPVSRIDAVVATPVGGGGGGGGGPATGLLLHLHGANARGCSCEDLSRNESFPVVRAAMS